MSQPVRQLIGTADANSSAELGAVRLPKGHNRWRAMVAHSDATAGDVTLWLDVPRPDQPELRLRSQVAELTYDADGGSAEGTVGPLGDARLGASVASWAGPAAAKTFVLVESWAEGQS